MDKAKRNKMHTLNNPSPIISTFKIIGECFNPIEINN